MDDRVWDVQEAMQEAQVHLAPDGDFDVVGVGAGVGVDGVTRVGAVHIVVGGVLGVARAQVGLTGDVGQQIVGVDLHGAHAIKKPYISRIDLFDRLD